MENYSKSNPATQAKKRWNAENYTQIKVYVDPKVASAFKETCAKADVSMAGALTRFMAEYSKTPSNGRQLPDYSTRRKRRAAVKSFTEQMVLIRDAEEFCRDNTPVNLRESSVYDQADEYVSLLEDAVELLNSIY